MEGSKQQRPVQVLKDPLPQTPLAASAEPGSLGYQGIPLCRVAGAVRLPAVQIALSRFPSILGSRQAQAAAS